MKDLTKIKSPFGMQSDKTRKRLKAAHDAREIIEFWGVYGWTIKGSEARLYPSATYRLQPAPELTQDSVDWSHVSDEIVCMVRLDSHIVSFGCPKVPEWGASGWRGGGGTYYAMDAFASYKRGTCAAKDSLVLRPKVAT